MTDSAELPGHLRLATRPVADPANVVAGQNWRITVLDAGLVRLEWSPSGRFTDLASQAVIDRSGEPVDFVRRENDRVLEIVTDRLHLTYDREAFSSHGLSVQVRGGVSSYHSTWRFGSQGEANLGGTARTLDVVDGRCELEDGVLAMHGVACYDDSHTVLLTDDGWFTAREPGSLDLYVFAYGRDYLDALGALYRLTGPQPQLPRWALGNWWSRYHAYTSDEYLELLARFDRERVPFSVAVLDMDWHLVDIPSEYGSGWTGYTWNRELIPDPPALLAALHERGMRVTLNVHPADGVRAHEEVYPQVAEAMGLDPAERLPVAFDPTDPRFLRAYLDLVHHPLEADGVDFWWLDWQQGRHSRVAGLDPLWLLNHLHFLDSARPRGPLGARPITFSRYAGVGSHRYPVGFSGDTVVTWASLAFQPEFTASASNVGYGWWSHDIGGHMFGGKDDELATRWVQLGVFSPLLRLHSTHDIFNSKEPWRFNRVAREVMGRYLRLRHRLLPYLATMARLAHTDGVPLVRPMYYAHPWVEDAYNVPTEFMFGTSLLVAPVVTPAVPSTGLARVEAWLPEGEWLDLFTGTVYRGGRRLALHRDLDSIPVLARPGAVLPLTPETAPESTVSGDTGVPTTVEVWVVAGADGEFTLLEDADDDAWASTCLEYRQGTLTIGAVEGEAATVGTTRSWRVVLFGAGSVTSASVDGRPLEVTPGPAPACVSVDLGERPSDAPVRVRFEGDLTLTGTPALDRIYTVIDDAQTAFADKTAIWDLVQRLSSPDAALALQAMSIDAHLRDAVTELLLAR
ncbi:MAG: TIM-barrel domain-containing protein [Actinomycetales bacterium]